MADFLENNNSENNNSVEHPVHYTSSDATCQNCGHPIECIDVTRHLSFSQGNAIKYIWRYNFKNGIEDLKKAIFYIQDIINQEEKSSKRTKDQKNRKL